MDLPLPRGVVTGLGAVAELSSQHAARITLDESPGLPHLPELPLRGPWAAPVGRLTAVLVDLPLELEAGRWRTASGAGRDRRRAQAMLGEDLDAVEELWSGYEGPAKLQVLGPLTAASQVELRNGDALVSDRSALADLTVSLVEGLVAHVLELRRRVPGAQWVVQVDEPRAARVTAGSVRRPSGWGTFAAMPATEAVGVVGRVVEAMHGLELGVVVHCCDPDPDWVLLTGSGADAMSLPLPASYIQPGEAAERLDRWWNDGRGLWVTPDRSAPTDATVSTVVRLGNILGADAEALSQRLVLAASCAWDPRVLAEGPDAAPEPVGARAYADLRQVWRRLGERG